MGTLILSSEWRTPASAIPQGSCGKYHIKKKRVAAGTSWNSHGACGIDEVLFTKPVQFTVLRQGKMKANDTESVWMSDSPQELYMAHDLATRALPGNVLVGGLGLGILLHLLRNRRDIDKITVVELSPEVITLVQPYLPESIEIIQGDFLKVTQDLELKERQFDTIIADIWKTGFEEQDKELYMDCRMTMEDCYPEALHLFWAFQRDYDEEIAQYGIWHLQRQGIELCPVGFD